MSIWFAIFENESSAIGFQIGLSRSMMIMKFNLEIPSLLSRNPLSECPLPLYLLHLLILRLGFNYLLIVSRPRLSSSHYLKFSSSVTDLRLDPEPARASLP